MSEKKGILELVLETYWSSCMMMAGLKGENNDPIASLVSGIIKTSQMTNLSMFRNILMDAELGPDELVKVEEVLKKVEARHTNRDVLESVRQIRSAHPSLQP